MNHNTWKMPDGTEYKYGTANVIPRYSPEELQADRQQIEEWTAQQELYEAYEPRWYQKLFRKKKPSNPLGAWRSLREVIEEGKLMSGGRDET